MGEAALKAAQIVFALGETETGPLLVLGIPEPAWDYIKDGKTNNIHLAKYGLPNVIICGGKSRAHILDMLGVFDRSRGIKLDLETDHSIPENEKTVIQMRERARAFLMRKAEEGDIRRWTDQDLDELATHILGGAQ